ncbi:SusC/RagA family TonB-linked outer membrane protein [Algoriphagus sp. C2-6-M1]|uniref:SusC/RagA family TonB-linked outer membrane protein n=1 Tax=Algoriphagus persicinus TaxID=3108754 RepID=UPI002B417DF7|nr:SusC/RagA family TonB-linked outer membrane protein [Algoriphagus sp. C2-6-M1]
MKNCLLKHVIYMTKLFTVAFIFQYLSMSLLIAGNGNAQVKSIENARVSLSLKSASIERVFQELEKNTEYNFVFASREIRDLPSISLESKGKTVYDVLLDIAAQTQLSFKQVDYNIHVKKSGVRQPVTVMQEMEVTVSGKVIDDTGEPLPGATVTVSGTTTGIVTDIEGKYTLNVPEGSTLVFSYVGYETKRVPVGNQTQIDVTLNPDISSLEEVVVVGYGEKSRRLMTESIGTVQAKEITKIPVASVDQAIQGRISGVQVTNVDGTPGSPVAIRIRGVGTVGNTQPLFVIDGIPVGNNSDSRTNPLATINPADIESISVLKDASAAAVYGVRAANGVVLITTKRGTKGKPKIVLDSYYGIQEIAKFNEYNSTTEWLSLTQAAYSNFNAQNGLTPEDPDFRELHPDLEEGSPIRDRSNEDAWREVVLNPNAPIQNVNLSVNGGGEGYNYYVSGGYFKQEATVQKWNLDRYTFRVNTDFNINKRLKVGQNFTVSHQEVLRGMNGGGDGFLLQNSVTMPPFFNIYEDPSNPILGNRYGYDGNADLAGLVIGNQVGINQIIQNNDRNTRLLGGIFAELEIIDGLKYKTAASLDLNLFNNDSWRPWHICRT